MPKDYLTQLLGNMQEQLNRLEAKQDDQTKQLEAIRTQTTKTNGRVTALEKMTKLMKRRRSNSFFERIDGRFLYLIALFAVVALIILAKIVFHINIGSSL